MHFCGAPLQDRNEKRMVKTMNSGSTNCNYTKRQKELTNHAVLCVFVSVSVGGKFEK